ncbi:hypothetical protein B0H13DRAFT_1606824 [Mycena leptocephala]|nr:hypothetical protein B0H13DRAFT_1606824 [Mycena leptocephala]
MDVQFCKLVIQPCQSLNDTAPLILLIDGLDECEGEWVQESILTSIGNTVRQHPATFRILLASRPEPHIRAESSFPYDAVNVEHSFNDIRRYFCDEFSCIHRQHSATMGDIPTPWPSPDIVEILVKKSSGYFIYASTVIKFIDDKCCRPTAQLKTIHISKPRTWGQFPSLRGILL